MEILIFTVVFIFCLFLLYLFCRHDFVLLRQNISPSQMFDALAVALVSAFILGRVFYVVNNFKTELLSFLRFFHVFKYPGISGFGFLIGAALGLYLIFMKKKGIGRICDIFTLSFFPLFATGILFDETTKQFFFLPILFFVLSIFLFIFLVRSHNKYYLRDGSISLIFFLFICIQTAIFQYITAKSNAVIFQLSILGILSLLAIPLILFNLYLNQRRKRT